MLQSYRCPPCNYQNIAFNSANRFCLLRVRFLVCIIILYPRLHKIDFFQSLYSSHDM